MSDQVAVSVEIGNTGGPPAVRILRVETLVPAEPTFESNLIEAGRQLQRLAAEAVEEASRQLAALNAMGHES